MDEYINIIFDGKNYQIVWKGTDIMKFKFLILGGLLGVFSSISSFQVNANELSFYTLQREDSKLVLEFPELRSKDDNTDLPLLEFKNLRAYLSNNTVSPLSKLDDFIGVMKVADITPVNVTFISHNIRPIEFPELDLTNFDIIKYTDSNRVLEETELYHNMIKCNNIDICLSYNPRAVNITEYKTDFGYSVKAYHKGGSYAIVNVLDLSNNEVYEKYFLEQIFNCDIIDSFTVGEKQFLGMYQDYTNTDNYYVYLYEDSTYVITQVHQEDFLDEIKIDIGRNSETNFKNIDVANKASSIIK